MNSNQKRTLLVVIAASVIGSACTRKPTVAAAPPPPPQARPAETQRAAAERPAAERPAARPQAAEAPAAAATQSRTPDAATRARISELLSKIADAYFDYDKANLRPDAMKVLQANATELRDILKDYPDYKLTIEGHADERGSAEYNLALGEKRAASAREYLVQIGIPGGQLGQTSYGNQRPVCNEETEACWQKNRRIHIVPTDAQTR